MHYAILVVCKKKCNETTEHAIMKELEPHRDNEFDWCQIGGRWTGLFDGYKPEKDPKNVKKGKVVWPTDWVRHDGDVIHIENLTKKQYDSFFGVAINGEWFQENAKPKFSEIKKNEGMIAAVVDCHG